MVARLLYYKKFVNTPKRTGLQSNPYDHCVSNIMIKDNQQTICFYVRYYKLSHQDIKVDDEFIKTLRDEYESVFEDASGKMKVIRGKVHD